MLKFTMETIFAQKYEPVEILIVDDGSTDGTRELVEHYGERVRYYRKEKSCIAETRTVACRLAKGEYIAFQDDDDLMPPERIPLLYEAMCRYPEAAFAVGDYEYIDPQGGRTGRRSRFKVRPSDSRPMVIEDGYSAVLWPLLTPLPHTTLFRKADGERIGWFDDARFFHACSDTDFYARLGRLGPIVYVPEVVSYYRMGHAQIWGKKLLSEYSRFLLLEKHLKDLDGRDRELGARLRQRLLSVLKSMAFLRRNGHSMPTSVPTDYIRRGLGLLGIGERISYYFDAGLRLPVRRLIKGKGMTPPGAVK
jgi:glycosyltransferase involved in cell wall biosynthesis